MDYSDGAVYREENARRCMQEKEKDGKRRKERDRDGAEEYLSARGRKSISHGWPREKKKKKKRRGVGGSERAGAGKFSREKERSIERKRKQASGLSKNGVASGLRRRSQLQWLRYCIFQDGSPVSRITLSFLFFRV